MTQASGSDIFRQDISQQLIDRADMEAYLAPGAIDGFVGMQVEVGDDEDRTQEEEDEQLGRFKIPQELLVKMPIMEVTKDTRIIHITKPTPATGIEKTGVNIANPDPGPSRMEDLRTSGVNENVLMVCNTSTSVADASQSEVIVTNTTGAPVQVNAAKPTNEPKKGYNTKNRKRNSPAEIPDPPVQDDSLRARMNILAEIADIVKRSNTRQSMSELDVWGQYIGMKVARVEGGRPRDEVLVDVERLINQAIHDRPASEE